MVNRAVLFTPWQRMIEPPKMGISEIVVVEKRHGAADFHTSCAGELKKFPVFRGFPLIYICLRILARFSQSAGDSLVAQLQIGGCRMSPATTVPWRGGFVIDAPGCAVAAWGGGVFEGGVS
jgi:hypothetical protein